EHSFREKRREVDDVDLRLAQVQERLRLPALPRRIECVDISHLGGNDTVGAVVSLFNGQPQKSRYRVFRVRGAAAGDDYGAMYEVLARRFRRGKTARNAAAASASPAPPVVSPAPPSVAGAPAASSASAAAFGRPGAAAASASSVAFAAPGADGDGDGDGEESSYVEMAVSPTPPPVGVAPGPAPRRGAGPARDDGDASDGDGDGGDGPMPVPAAGSPARQAGEGWELPDLLVVDGGRGQLNVALAAARDLGLHDLPVVGLAKERVTIGGEELVDRVYVPGQKNGIPLRPQSAALFFLARARDEAHRFSNYARERLAKSRSFRSLLDDVPGLSKRARVALLTAFGSAFSVRDATDAELLAVPGVGPRAVEALREHYRSLPAETMPTPPSAVAAVAAAASVASAAELQPTPA
ncbi:MAG TPA: hypothetical protein VFS00_15405, partial [Polyangiaceae bacterium]|nr:hypothetical protein [Polyangiaceae bacterium]